MIATGSCECRTNLGIGEATGKGGVAAIPHVGRQVAAGFFHDQLYQGARVEVDDGHRLSAAVRSPALRQGGEDVAGVVL